MDAGSVEVPTRSRAATAARYIWRYLSLIELEFVIIVSLLYVALGALLRTISRIKRKASGAFC
jgi:hypothetical protein